MSAPDPAVDAVATALVDASHLNMPPAEIHATACVAVAAVRPAIEADLLDRVAAIYESEAAGALGDYAALSYSATAVVGRLRYWRDNLEQLRKTADHE